MSRKIADIVQVFYAAFSTKSASCQQITTFLFFFFFGGSYFHYEMSEKFSSNKSKNESGLGYSSWILKSTLYLKGGGLGNSSARWDFLKKLITLGSKVVYSSQSEVYSPHPSLLNLRSFTGFLLRSPEEIR